MRFDVVLVCLKTVPMLHRLITVKPAVYHQTRCAWGSVRLTSRQGIGAANKRIYAPGSPADGHRLHTRVTWFSKTVPGSSVAPMRLSQPGVQARSGLRQTVRTPTRRVAQVATATRASQGVRPQQIADSACNCLQASAGEPQAFLRSTR